MANPHLQFVRCSFVAFLIVFFFCGCNTAPNTSSADPPREGWDLGKSNSQNAPSAGPRANSQPSGARYDLAADEQRGGHSVRKHVAQSDDELRQRLQREPDISAASTWTDLPTAEETVAAALQAQRTQIARWSEQGSRRRNIALHYDAGRPIGRTIRHGSSQAQECSRAVVVLRADGSGFYVLTTYPEAP